MDETRSKFKNESNIIDIQKQVAAKIEQEKKIYEKQDVGLIKFSSKEIIKALNSNEDGDAWLYIQIHKDGFCYDHSNKTWFKWDGNYWKEDQINDSLAAIDGVVEVHLKEASNQANLKLQAIRSQNESIAKKAETIEKEILARIRQLQSLKRKKNILVLAAAGIDSLGITGDQWDKNPFILPCANGIIELQTGTLRAGVPAEYIKTTAPTKWKGIDFPAPVWDETIYEIFEGNIDLINFFKLLIGYAISGLSTEPIFVILCGDGRNGKGTIMETLKKVLGPLVGPIDAEMLLSQKNTRSSASPRPDILQLQGKRIIWASESDQDRRLDIGKMKWLTGDDTLIGRPVFGKNNIEFDPTHTLFLLTNHKPHIPPEEYAAWQRVKLIEFGLSFVDNPRKKNERKRDPKLKEKLLSESSGILAWIVRGFLEWQKKGLNAPDIVNLATKKYHEDEDTLGQFIKECCVLSTDVKIQSTPLFNAYKKWCEVNGYQPLNQVNFGKRMFKKFERKGNPYRVYKGIDLLKTLSSQ
jgi:putative DNA primase/helicase